MPGLLSKKATLRFGIEAVVGANPGLATTNSVEVSDPDYTVDPTVLQRNYTSNDLSPFEDRIGRVLAGFEFKTKLGGNGKIQSGLQADTPMIAKLINACGYDLVYMTGTSALNQGPVVANFDNPASAPVITWVAGAVAVTVVKAVVLELQVVTPGASGTATISVTSSDTTVQPNIAATVATSGTPFPLGSCGSIVPTWAGALVAGQKWHVAVFPKGVKCVPISAGQKTGSIELYRDGLKMEGNAALGTFQIEGTAGDYAEISFRFLTTFVDPTGAAQPDDDIVNVNPPMVELAGFTWAGNNTLIVEKFTLDQNNQIEARPSVNHAKGYFGCRITSRAPQGGFNPEAELEADQPFWSDFTKSKTKSFFTRIGTDVGNTVVLYCPRAQTSDMKFGDRQGLLTYEKTFNAKRVKGDDETIIVFC